MDYLVSLKALVHNNSYFKPHSSVAISTLPPYFNVLKYTEGKNFFFVWCNFTVVSPRLVEETWKLCTQIFTWILAAHCVLPLNVIGWLVLSFHSRKAFSLLLSPSQMPNSWAVSFSLTEADVLAWMKSKVSLCESIRFYQSDLLFT